ncbi:hypothetical protein ACLIYP_28760, partial [Streptomyces nanhaiensis]
AAEPRKRIDAVLATGAVEVLGCGVPAGLPGVADAELRAATDHLPARAALPRRTRCDAVVAARTGPAGVDAGALREAAALHGGPPVHTAGPVPWTPLRGTASGPPDRPDPQTTEGTRSR